MATSTTMRYRCRQLVFFAWGLGTGTESNLSWASGPTLHHFSQGEHSLLVPPPPPRVAMSMSSLGFGLKPEGGRFQVCTATVWCGRGYEESSVVLLSWGDAFPSPEHTMCLLPYSNSDNVLDSLLYPRAAPVRFVWVTTVECRSPHIHSLFLLFLFLRRLFSLQLLDQKPK